MSNIENRVFNLVRNFKQYGYYKKNLNNGYKLLNKSFPSISYDDCSKIINTYCIIFEKVGEYIIENRELSYLEYSNNTLERWLINGGFDMSLKDEYGINRNEITLMTAAFRIQWIIIR